MYNRRLIISEEERKNILSLHENTRRKELGLMVEAYDQNTKTYSTESGLIMYGDSYNSESATNSVKAYVIKFPIGSKAMLYTSKSPVSKNVVLSGGQMTSPRKQTVGVTLVCGQKSFTYYDKGSSKTITLYNTGLESFVTKMDNIFCKGKIAGSNDDKKIPTTTPTMDQVKDCKNKLSFKQGMKGEPIKQVQGLLGGKYANILGTTSGNTYDGNFGPKTTQAVKQFQTDNGLTPDGVVGCKTMIKMLEILKSSVKIDAPVTPSNPDLAIGNQSSTVNLTQNNQNLVAGL